MIMRTKVPKEAIHMALDEMILKGKFPNAIKTLEEIAKHKKITIYEVMEEIMKDLKLTSFEAIFKAFHNKRPY